MNIVPFFGNAGGMQQQMVEATPVSLSPLPICPENVSKNVLLTPTLTSRTRSTESFFEHVGPVPKLWRYAEPVSKYDQRPGLVAVPWSDHNKPLRTGGLVRR